MIPNYKTYDTDILTQQFSECKAHIEQMNATLDAMKAEITARATFADGKAQVGTVAIRQQAKITYDQAKIAQLREPFGSDFDMLFKAEFKPADKKVIDAYLQNGQFKDGLAWAQNRTEYLVFTVKDDTKEVRDAA